MRAAARAIPVVLGLAAGAVLLWAASCGRSEAVRQKSDAAPTAPEPALVAISFDSLDGIVSRHVINLLRSRGLKPVLHGGSFGFIAEIVEAERQKAWEILREDEIWKAVSPDVKYFPERGGRLAGFREVIWRLREHSPTIAGKSLRQVKAQLTAERNPAVLALSVPQVAEAALIDEMTIIRRHYMSAENVWDDGAEVLVKYRRTPQRPQEEWAGIVMKQGEKMATVGITSVRVEPAPGAGK